MTSAAWSDDAGARWKAWVVGLGVLLFAIGFAAPLADIDFPLHLATGEWIARHGVVPMTEPFAWTREGAPFYAYSWLVELLYYTLLRAAGPLGVHLLQGALLAAVGASAYALGRASAWRPWTTLFVATLHALLAVTLVPFARPQLALFALVPAAWAATLRVLDADRPARWAVLLALLAALAANAHILFPLTALPGILLVARAAPLGPRWRRFGLVAVALVAGWMASPYALHWGEVFRQNFTGNVLIVPPSPIAEYKAGFTRADGWRGLTMPFAIGLAVLPWCVPADARRGWRAAWLAAAWLVGLIAFAAVSKALFIWWLATIPLTAVALDRLPPPSSRLLRRARWATLYAIAVVLLAQMTALRARANAAEGSVAVRTMPSPAAVAVEPLAAWLDAHGAPPLATRADVPLARRTRILTVFEYGDYLIWRLPGAAVSTDGRTIFPDSVAGPDAYQLARNGPPPLGPWRQADVAIVPLRYPVAAVLDTARGWRRVATVPESERVPVATGLWVSDRWRQQEQQSPRGAGAAP